ncbi:MAG: helix-turn-helix transcriptional regulator [Hyphomonas sp.]|uniref:helix-turn-helix transcriptional regulator n=1 Tax=Hyphomonas sp. TaxID=87 RepID=UPI0005F22B80|nr:helix-turn-helix transcriptional regulator [Hyphomonas sp.]KJS28033.1 MAG: XRE family transcriptional regulator [Hyphomonadaceae bacterium BRH_c29]MBU3920120.1 helix-turn-helix domain-containing protein [Alphaproteobacteria bacterium]MBA3070169.1 helix-turn-helix transcriptional regulator [Hyphomonas sp.]MBU4060255.1 helix-turn-helix domain-containing protein [Alphaproteobacteria bacterium]MBU4162923.1 helix-turn-helix domain-containing protein [Alphaproteobacteria bacterium]
MAKQTRTYAAMTKDALILMGKQIQLARKARHMSAAELAERVGVARSTLWRIEQGEPGVEIGLVFEAAILAGVPLFEKASGQLTAEIERLNDKLALLPASIRDRSAELKDDF